MKRSEKKEFVQKLKDEIDKSSSVIVTHFSGLSVHESEQLRSEMRDNGAKFKVTKNRLTKLALEQTQFKELTNLFTGPTAIAYSDDPVAPAKVAVSFEKKLENFKIIGGGYDGEKIDLEKINFLATLSSVDELRGKIVGLISAPAQKIASIVKEPAGQMVRLVSVQSKSLEKSN
mgnify:CR=1 FL=1